MKGIAALAGLAGLGIAAAAAGASGQRRTTRAPARVDRTSQATRAIMTDTTPGDPVAAAEAALRAIGSRPARRRYRELERFQLAAWLNVDGLYGPNTAAALRHYLPGRTVPAAVYPGTATWTPSDAAEVYTAGVHPTGIPLEVAIGDIARDLGEVFLPGMGKHAADKARAEIKKRDQTIRSRDGKIRELEARIRKIEGERKKLADNIKKTADNAKKAGADAKKRLDAAKKQADACARERKRLAELKSRHEKQIAQLKKDRAAAAKRPQEARGMAADLARALMAAAPSDGAREDVAAFQAAAGLEPTGLYDSQTAAALQFYGIRTPPEPWFQSSAAAGPFGDPEIDPFADPFGLGELDGLDSELDQIAAELGGGDVF